MTDLSHATTDALIDELRLRFDCIMFVGEKLCGEGMVSDDERRVWAWSVSPLWAMGLAQYGEMMLQDLIDMQAAGAIMDQFEIELDDEGEPE